MIQQLQKIPLKKQLRLRSKYTIFKILKYIRIVSRSYRSNWMKIMKIKWFLYTWMAENMRYNQMQMTWGIRSDQIQKVECMSSSYIKSVRKGRIERSRSWSTYFKRDVQGQGHCRDKQGKQVKIHPAAATALLQQLKQENVNLKIFTYKCCL